MNETVENMKCDFGEYTGQVLDGKPHGQGKATYRDGNGRYLGTFEGEFENGQRKRGKWDGKYDEYEGEFADDMFDGYGVKKWDCNVHYYKGEWKQGRYHGKGIRDDYNGIWDGEWVNGHINGNGTFTSKKGWVFTGRAVEHWEIEGTGTITFPNGDVYVGEVGSSYDSMGNLSMHGEGTYTYSDGSTYQGTFHYGHRKADVDAEIQAKKEEERRLEAARLEAERREAEERAKDPVAYDAAKKKAYREYLEEKCKVLYGGTTDIRRRFGILGEAYFQAHNSGFNDHMAWEASTGRYDVDIEFWNNACRLKHEVEALCEIYKKELEENVK